MGNIAERVCSDNLEVYGLLADAMLKLLSVKKKAEEDARDARKEVFWLLRTRQRQQAIHYVEHVCQAEDIRDITIIMQEYCLVMMNDVKNLRGTKGDSSQVKEARAGFHFIATRFKELSSLHNIDVTLISKLGLDPLYRSQVNSDVVRKLYPRAPREERKEKLLQEIAAEWGFSLSDAGAGSPEIVESCRICSMAEAQNPKADMPTMSSASEGHPKQNMLLDL